MPKAVYIQNIRDRNKASVVFDATGLISIQYGGTEFLYDNTCTLNYVTFAQQFPFSGTAKQRTVYRYQNKLVDDYAWGRVEYQFRAQGPSVFVSIRISNVFNAALTGFDMSLTTLVLPSAPSEYDGSTPMILSNIGDPTVIPLTHHSGIVALVNEDVVGPLLIGFPFALNRPTSTIFPLKVDTGTIPPMYPTSTPFITRPIHPGETLNLSLSLRFGPVGATTTTIASDIYRTFANTYPFSNSWPDHTHSIGQLILATSNTGYATNPRGWFNDPTIDVTNPSGIAAFQTRLLNAADSYIDRLLFMGSQGVITWDIEGQQYPQAISYIGDPRIAETLAPELVGILDSFFAKFTNAGLRTGVLLRPQQFTNNPPAQNEVSNPVALMTSKIQYAINRWGCRLFYVDSNFDTTLNVNGNTMAASVFEQLAAAFPNVLLMPEHQNTQYYDRTAPYNELRSPSLAAATPSSVRPTVYPSAFSLINTADGDLTTYHDQLLAGILAGDILLYRAFFASAELTPVRQLYVEAFGPIPVQPGLVASSSSGSTDGITTTTPAIDSSTADLLITAVSSWDNPGGMPITLVDSMMNSGWTPLTSRGDANVRYVFYYCLNPAHTGPGHTITINPTDIGDFPFPAVIFAAFRGFGGGFDVENGSVDDAFQPGSITPSVINELVICGTGYGFIAFGSIDSGFTVLDTVTFSGGQHFGNTFTYKIKHDATPENPTLVLSNNAEVIAIASFKPSP